MTAEEITAKVNDILIDGFEIEPSDITPGKLLAEDLGLDSLDAVDLVVAMEKAFQCRVDETQVRSLRTVGDLYEFVACHAGKQA